MKKLNIILNFKVIFFSIMYLASSTAFAQVDLGISGNPNPDKQGKPSSSTIEEVSTRDSVPSEAIIKYEKGEAPFYVDLQSYSHILFRAYMNRNENILASEAKMLGVNISDLEAIALTLNKFTELSFEEWTSILTGVCEPVLKGLDISNQYAKEAIAQLDDSTERRNAIAHELMNDIRDSFGQDVANKLTYYINEHGKGIDFSKADLVKGIAARNGGDFKAYLANQCNTL